MEKSRIPKRINPDIQFYRWNSKEHFLDKSKKKIPSKLNYSFRHYVLSAFCLDTATKLRLCSRITRGYSVLLLQKYCFFCNWNLGRYLQMTGISWNHWRWRSILSKTQGRDRASGWSVIPKSQPHPIIWFATKPLLKPRFCPERKSGINTPQRESLI